MQHTEEQCAFQIKGVFACTRKLFNYRPAAGLLPQPLEHQSRSYASAGDWCRLLVIERGQHHCFFRKPRTGS